MLFLNPRFRFATALVLCVLALIVFLPSLAFGADGPIVSLFERALVWAEANPVLAVALIGIVWPALTGAASLLYHRFEARFPNLIATLRASGLDIPQTARNLVALLWPKRLPKPPTFPTVLFILAAACAAVALLGCGGALEELADDSAKGLAAGAELSNVCAESMDERLDLRTGKAAPCAPTDAMCLAEAEAESKEADAAINTIRKLFCKYAPEGICS